MMDLFLLAVFPALILQGTSVFVAFSELSILDFLLRCVSASLLSCCLEQTDKQTFAAGSV